MSKKQLLNESEIRRFMKLANLEPLAKIALNETHPAMNRETMGHLARSEAQDPMAATPDAAMDAPPSDAEMGGEEDALDVEVGGDTDPEKQSVFKAAVQALADALDIEVELEGSGEEETGEEETGEEETGEEEADEEEAGEEALDEEEEKEEEKALSEDALVEAVLARVTARLVAEAKKKKMSVKEKMKLKSKKKEAKKEVVEEALDGVNLSEKGKEQKNVWKGHADMEMGKGEKGGKGGHELETLSAKAEHTVTHGGKNLATLGGNKK